MELEKLLGSEITDCPCGKVHRVPTAEVHLHKGCLEELPQAVDRHFADGAIVCAADANTWAAAGQRAADMLRRHGRPVEVHYVDRHAQPAHADRQTVEELAAVLKKRQVAGLLAVGAGTINDIGKSAATAADRPLVTVATAASMNGYPSAISALTVEGVKITEPCRPPLAIIADPLLLATAPAKMTGAGFGDLLSKNASTADWVSAHKLHGEYFCAFAAEVAEEAVNRCIENADAIRQNRPAGLAVLAEALMRSGIAMVLAGSSAPASGGEHLISHLWDMTARWSGRTPALHGEQTGVTTLISLRLYEKLLALDAAAVRRLVQRKPVQEDPAAFETRMRSTFGDIAEAVLPFARQKYLDGPALQQRRRLICDRWEEIRRAVAPVVIAADTSRAYLLAAGAVFRTADLGISTEDVEFAYRNARWIRNRYTVLDLAAELGVLEDWQADVLVGI
jgi:glycerol-1-phosphate dehydrogenase [NAD(P)+]